MPALRETSLRMTMYGFLKSLSQMRCEDRGQGAGMQLGMVGLGPMCANMTRRLMRGGHTMVVSDLSADAVKGIAGEGAVASSSLDDLVSKLTAPRAGGRMAPGGPPPR